MMARPRFLGRAQHAKGGFRAAFFLFIGFCQDWFYSRMSEISSPIAILVTANESKYSAIRFFLARFAEAFQQAGAEVRYLREDNHLPIEAADISRSFLFYFASLAEVGAQDYRWVQPDLLQLSYVLDHPLYYVPIKAFPPRYFPVLLDTAWRPFIARHCGPRQPPMLVLPHAGYTNAPLQEAPPLLAERSVDILFSASIEDPEEIRRQWHEQMPGAAQALDAIVEQCNPLQREYVDLAAVLEQGLSFPIDPNWEIFRNIFRFADQYIRAVRRIAGLRALADAGMEVECHVDQPDLLGRLLGKHAFQIHSAKPFEAILERMRETKIVLTTLPHATSERIPSAMLNGAVSVSDTNPMLLNTFVEDHQAVYFRWKELAALPDKLRGLLADPERMREIASAGREQALAAHTVDHHARVILDSFFRIRQNA